MKKFKKISLELNKEVITNLSNDNLNQVKGGTIIQSVRNCTPSVHICQISYDIPCQTDNGAVQSCNCMISAGGSCICTDTVNNCIEL